MILRNWRYALCGLLTGTILLGEAPIHIYATEVTEIVEGTEALGGAAAEVEPGSIPVAGISLFLTNQTQEANEKVVEMMNQAVQQTSEKEAQVVEAPKSEYADIAIAQVNNYVNVRAEDNTESEILGKLYNNSAATVLETTESGWYKITSGSVTGYVKCEYVVVGDEELARRASTRYATVTTETLFVRMEPSTEAKILTMLPEGDDFVTIDESMKDTGWVMVTTSEGDGYVSTDYVELWTDFVTAESREEEEARLKKEEEERRKAAAAAEAARKKQETSSSSGSSSYSPASGSNGQAVVNYASQFVGNPYVYGGTSLTNGADCSGFVMSVYAAFGVSLPHSSKSMRSVGYEVSTSSMQPGDIVCYSGHVGIYVGNDTIVHASNASDGIKYTSPVAYKNVICVRRIF